MIFETNSCNFAIDTKTGYRKLEGELRTVEELRSRLAGEKGKRRHTEQIKAGITTEDARGYPCA